MSKNLFITGTGTDVGKTYISGLITKKLKENGYNIGYFKTAMSGNIRNDNGELLPGDAIQVKNMSKISQSLDSMCPYVYENPLSPHLASRIEGNYIDMNVVKKYFYDLNSNYDFLTIEGSGGIACPLSFDNCKLQLIDIVKMFNLPSIIVADAGLGTINNVVLTAEYMKANGLTVKGIIFNHFHKGNVMEEDNKFMCEYLTGLKVLGCVEQNDNSIDIDIETLISLYN